MKRVLVLVLLASAFAAPITAHAADGDVTTVDELIVVAPAPLGGGVSLNRLGQTISSVGAEDLAKTGSLSVTEALQQSVAGVNVADTQGNPFTSDVNYRGFSASPLQGLPQGLAVYLNGQRLNEAFGDTMNWDLIPKAAITRIDLVTSNPAFGLNALGGALALRTRDGFTWQGVEANAESGAFGTRTGALQGGWENGSFSAYGVIDGGEVAGWRPNSGSSASRAFGDLGMKAMGGEFHLVAGSSDSRVGVIGPTPVDLLDADPRVIFTFPQTSHNQAQFAALNGRFDIGGGWSLQGGLHTRRFTQAHLDGNDSDFERCASTGPLANTLCLQSDGFPSSISASEFQVLTSSGTPIPCPVSTVDTDGCRNQINSLDGPRVPYGTLDRTWTNSKTTGTSVQVSSDNPLFGRKNTLSFGASYDASDIHFRSNSTLGLINPELEVVDTYYPLPNITGTVPGLGQVIHTGPDVAYGPADLDVKSNVSGVFAANTIDLTPDLSLTLGGRYNSQKVDLKDLTGVNPSLTSNHRFSRVNPAANLAWRHGEQTWFAGYSETNRAPTPLELGCSDPDKPCLLENSLVSDPPLRQVISRTFEAGTRGSADLKTLSISWTASAFTTDNTDDIVSLASNLSGRGYYANVPKTRRRGFETQLNFDTAKWSAFLGYSVVNATYEFAGTLASPNNPVADANGDIQIQPGDHLGGIPAQRAKAGADLKVTPKLTLGFDTQYTGSQYVVGDEGNDNPKLPGYWTADARVDYAITEKVCIFGRIDNLFNEQYGTFGTYFDAGGVRTIRPQPLPLDPEEQSVTPGAPRGVYVGLRARF